ncbi:hypothetical protein AGDE_07315 [Angomonas deanei]|nr:hypothetical protein AGDE_07315 [Angomonas deanei]|eukprot:EPY35469.1 hypothetical protein AGDE_07315 [Angomonas deanei]
MGASQRKEAVQQFVEWAGSPGEPDEEQFFSKVSLYSNDIISGVELFAHARPVAESLMENAKYNNRIHWLLKFASKQAQMMVENQSAATQPQIALLWVVELTLRHILRIVGGHSQELLQFMETTSQPVANVGANLCSYLLDYILEVKLNTLTVMSHLAVARLLITMTSTALHHNTKFDETKIDIFTELILSSKHIDQIVNVLLRRLVKWGTTELPSAPTLYSGESAVPSFLNLFGMFSRPSAETGADGEPVYVFNSSGAFEMVGRLSSQLLCILLVHQKGNGKNTVLSRVAQLKNNDPVSYTSLLQAISNKLTSCPTLCLLLYTLLYDHQTFLNDVMQSDVGSLTDVAQQALHLMYRIHNETEVGARRAGNHKNSDGVIVAMEEDPSDVNVLKNIMHDALQFSYPFVNTFVSTILFILSQDQLTNKIMCDTVLTTTFLREKSQVKMSLGALSLNVLCLNVSRAFADNNESLVSVLVPCMVNISLFVHDMDRNCAQRLAALLCLLTKKIRKMDDRENGENSGEEEESPAKIAGRRKLYLRQLTMVVEVVENLIRNSNEYHNEHLIYELLYHRSRIIDVFEESAGKDGSEAARKILSNVAAELKSYEEVISAASTNSPPQIIQLLREKGSTGDVEMQEFNVKPTVEDLQYSYEEIANSYIFFGPFVWSTMLTCAQRPGGILFSLSPLELNIFPH